jgi:Do/DeqQ family serine protease
MKFAFKRRVCVIMILLSFGIPSWAALPVFDSQGEQLPSLAPLLKEINSSVVNIATYTTREVQQNPMMSDPFFRRFFNIPETQQAPQQRRAQSAGSGVIIDAKKGTVVTNHHVVDGADEIVVSLEDGRSYDAELIGSDPEADVAVLKLQDFKQLTELSLADSDNLLVGDFVIAIGNPFGLGQTVTSGVVSALGRSGLGIEGYEDFIQTDASINPGNSGGALVNLRGELIGINTAIIAPSGGNVGIGFAIPIKMVKSSVDQILEYGEVRRGQLGVVIQDLTTELAEAFDIDRQQQGVVIAEVQKNSAADEAGVIAGDIITHIDGKALESASKLRNEVGLRRIGDNVRLKLLRDGREKTIKVTIGEAQSTLASNSSDHPFLAGATLKADSQGEGVEVVSIERQSMAARSGLREGDVILSANRQRIVSLEDLNKAIDKSDKRIVLRVKRGNAALYLVLQ